MIPVKDEIGEKDVREYDGDREGETVIGQITYFKREDGVHPSYEHDPGEQKDRRKNDVSQPSFDRLSAMRGEAGLKQSEHEIQADDEQDRVSHEVYGGKKMGQTQSPERSKTPRRWRDVFMADAKGFEPSIFSVTGRRVNRATPRVHVELS
jgi:hypothetical protein